MSKASGRNCADSLVSVANGLEALEPRLLLSGVNEAPVVADAWVDTEGAEVIEIDLMSLVTDDGLPLVQDHLINPSAEYEDTPLLGVDGVSNVLAYTVQGGMGTVAGIWVQRLADDGSATGAAVQLTVSEMGVQEMGGVSGDTIVYTDMDFSSPEPYVVMAVSISTGESVVVRQNDMLLEQPRIDGDTVIWRERGATGESMMMYDLSWLGTAIEPVAIGAGTSFGPAISDGLAVWGVTGDSSTPAVMGAYDVAAGVAVAIPGTPSQALGGASMGVSGPWVVFCSGPERLTPDTIQLYNIDTGEARSLTGIGGIRAVAIDGNIVTYESSLGNNRDVHAFNIADDSTYTLTTDPGPQALGGVLGDLVAYTYVVERDARIHVSQLMPGVDISLGAATGGTVELLADGTTARYTLGAEFSGSGEFTFTAADPELTSNVGTVTIVGHTNTPPVADAGGPYVLTEGVAAMLDGSGSSDADDDALTYEWDLDYDGVTFDVDAVGVAPATSFDDDVAARTIGLRVSDGSDAAIATTTLAVLNAAPEVDVWPGMGAEEGSVVDLLAIISDWGTGDTHAAVVDWGDGVVEAVAVDQEAGALTATHVYVDEGEYVTTVTVTDDDGAVADGQSVVIVTNAAPVIEMQIGDQTLFKFEQFDLLAIYSDAGADDQITAQIEWGDGVIETGLVDMAAGTIVGSHAYVADGEFTVTVSVFDGDGGVASSSIQVTVLSSADAVGSVAEKIAEMDLPTSVSASLTARLNWLGWYMNRTEGATGWRARISTFIQTVLLNSFVRKVNRWEARGEISADDAAELLHYAELIQMDVSN